MFYCRFWLWNDGNLWWDSMFLFGCVCVCVFYASVSCNSLTSLSHPCTCCLGAYFNREKIQRLYTMKRKPEKLGTANLTHERASQDFILKLSQKICIPKEEEWTIHLSSKLSIYVGHLIEAPVCPLPSVTSSGTEYHSLTFIRERVPEREGRLSALQHRRRTHGIIPGSSSVR